MPTFGTRSRAQLATCHPDLRALFEEVIKHVDCSVICGSRSKSEQDAAVAAGNSRARWPTSNHNVDGVRRRTAWAADVVPYPLDWNDHAAFRALGARVKAIAAEMHADGRMKHALSWGGDWRFLDLPHYELVDVEPGT